MIIDIIVLFILLASSAIAFIRGFIREVLTIAGIGGGVVAAYFFGPFFLPVVLGWYGVVEGEEPKKLFDILPYDILATGTAYGLILVGVVAGLSLLSHILSEFAKNFGLGALDRSLGVLFGIARGIIVLSLMYQPMFYFASEEETQRWFEGSKTHVYIESTARWVSDIIAQNTEKTWQDHMGKLKEQTNTAREQLKAIDILENTANSSEKIFDNKPQSEPSTETDAGKDRGYNKEFRQDMNRLIKKEGEQ